MLAGRLASIHDLFGQISDTLEAGWVQIAMQDEAAAKQLIDRTVVTRNPFGAKYSVVEDDHRETCAKMLNAVTVKVLNWLGQLFPLR